MGRIRPSWCPRRDDRPFLADLRSDSDDAAQFNLVIERVGANLENWPGRSSMGTEFVARLPLSKGQGTCCVVLHRAPLALGTLTLPRPAELRVERLGEESEFATAYGTESDGTFTMIDYRAEALS